MPVWIVWIILTLISWGIWAVLFRLIGDTISPAHCQALSTIGILPVLAALVTVRKSPTDVLGRRGILLALGSGVFSCLGNIACYEALNHAKAATVVPLTALYPVVTVLLAVPLLKERVTPIQWTGIAVSLVAIYLFNVPQSAEMQSSFASTWMLLPLAAVILWGITGLMQKAATNHISARLSAIWFLIAFIPVASLILFLKDPLPSNPALKTWALTAAMGFTLALGNYTVLLAFSSGGKASIITPLAGLYPLVSIPIAIIAFHERLTWRESLGIVLALTAVVMLSLQSETENAPPQAIEPDTAS